MSRRVTVLYGGRSAEREVSLVSGQAAHDALSAAGFTSTLVDADKETGALVEAITASAPDTVFNALHGRYGEDGCIQGLLDLMGVPYTHSGRMASALAMDKPMAKKLFASAGIRVAEDKVVTAREAANEDVLPRPYVIKPLNEGSSVGVAIVKDGSNTPPVDQLASSPDTDVMVERFVPGREVTVAVMGDRALAVTEITTGRGFYDYEAKYAAGGSEHILPAALPTEINDEALHMSLAAHKALGCRGVTRADIRFDGRDLYMLEVNTQPGLTPTSLVPEQAAHVGLEFPDLLSWMVEHAACDA